MRSNKAGLADLKRLHQTALEEQRVRQQRELAELRARQQSQLVRSTTETSPEELKHFARATQAVTPIKAAARVLHHPSEATRSEVMHQRRQRAVGQERSAAPALSDTFTPFQDGDNDLAWLAPGMGPEVLRQLRRAFWPVGAHLDLHGMNSDQARAALAQFIDLSLSHRTRCVRIVHGKGYGSIQGQSVLKARVAQWLTQLGTISAFASAPAAHGGRGALLVLLRVQDSPHHAT